jgi:hypothetical protein
MEKSPKIQPEHYVQFPLCALAFEKGILYRLETIICYSIMEAGKILWSRLHADQRQAYREKWQQAQNIPRDYNPISESHACLLLGAELVSINFGGFDHAVSHYEALAAFRIEYERRYGIDAEVRIKTDMIYAARDNRGFSYDDFSVLCAIYSSIGDKPVPVRITRQTIRHRSMGYKKFTILEAELSRRIDGRSPLSEHQIRDCVARLHSGKFFARATTCRRFTFYSHRLDHDQLRKAIFDRRTYRAMFHAQQSAQDRAMDTAIHDLS